MIERIIIAAIDEEEERITSPPERTLDVEVISGVVTLRTYIQHEDGSQALEHEVEVVARSLLRALAAAVEDSEDPLPRRIT